MMLVQVGLSFILIMTRMIYYAYYVLGPPLTGYDKLVGSFLMSFTTQVYYANYCKSFYVYTLSSSLFRRIFIKRVKIGILKLFCRTIPAGHAEHSAKTMETIIAVRPKRKPEQ